MPDRKRPALIALAALLMAASFLSVANARGRMISVMSLDQPASTAFAAQEAATGTPVLSSDTAGAEPDAAATDTVTPIPIDIGIQTPDPGLTGKIVAAAIYYEGTYYDVPREQTDLLVDGAAMPLMYRGKTVGAATITQADLYPCCDLPLAAMAGVSLNENLGEVNTLLAVSGDAEESTRTFRAQISMGAINSYHHEYVRVGQVGLRKHGVSDKDAALAQPAEFAIVQPASGTPLLVAGSLVVPRSIPECANVYDRIECVRYAFFMVAGHQDKSLKPISWSFTDGDDLLTYGWENPVDVLDVDSDGDADLVTQACDLEGCSFRIYSYHEGDLTLVFRGTRWLSARQPE